MALNRIPELLQRKTASVPKVTIVDHWHEILVQVQSLVNCTVDLLAMNVGRQLTHKFHHQLYPRGYQ